MISRLYPSRCIEMPAVLGLVGCLRGFRARLASLASVASGEAVCMRALAPIAGAVLVVLAVGGCGSTATRTTGRDGGGPATTRTVRVSGEVARSCAGPFVLGRPRRCSDRAAFERNSSRVVVHGKFSIRLRSGTYHVSVDSCINQQTLTITRAIAGLRLVPGCALPM